MNPQKKYQRLLNILAALVFSLLLLGNLVRNMKAGLSCPDWPLCYGKIIPHFNPLIIYEFSHRVLAGVISFIFVYLFVKAIQLKVPKNILLSFSLAGLVLISQITLGALTVLKLLNSNIVALHLITGVSFFLVIFFIKIQFQNFFLKTQTEFFKKPLLFIVLTWLIFSAIFIQTFLGGLVASNYAGLSCQGFPTCNGEWWPTMEGSVFFHMIHRIVAFGIIGLGIYLFYLFKKYRHQEWFTKKIHRYCNISFVLITVQIGVGISNIFFAIPITLSIIHLALAALLLVNFLKLGLELSK